MFCTWLIWFLAGLKRRSLCTALNCDARFDLESFILSIVRGLFTQGSPNRYEVADCETFYFDQRIAESTESSAAVCQHCFWGIQTYRESLTGIATGFIILPSCQ
jgi:hypothetical protein